MKIFCAESLWDKNLTYRRSSVKPILDLLINQYNTEYTHFTFNTSEELEYLFSLFGKSKYDVMYICSHMEYGHLKSGYNSEFTPFIRSFIDKHEKILKGKILHLAGCSSLSLTYLDVDDIKQNSRLSMLSGYRLDSEWNESSVLDYLYFTALQTEKLELVSDFMEKNYSQLIERTGFTSYLFQRRSM